jgi:hypothetical protein
MILGVDLNNFLVVNLLILGITTDSNFFPIIAQTKAIPRLLGEVRAEIQKAWSDH